MPAYLILCDHCGDVRIWQAADSLHLQFCPNCGCSLGSNRRRAMEGQ